MMATKRKRSSSSTESPIKMEAEEDSSLGSDYMVAKGQLQAVQSDSDNSSLHYEDPPSHYEDPSSHDEDLLSHDEGPPSHDEDPASHDEDSHREQRTVLRHMFVMNPFDRIVDLANFAEDTPMYPICRAWMSNQPTNSQSVQSTMNPMPPNADIWSSNSSSYVYRLPRPKGAANSAARIPSPTPQQKTVTNDINLNYEKNPPVAKEELMKDHLKRWIGIKKKWIKTAAVNEERYSQSKTILQAIFNKEMQDRKH